MLFIKRVRIRKILRLTEKFYKAEMAITGQRNYYSKLSLSEVLLIEFSFTHSLFLEPLVKVTGKFNSNIVTGL